MTIESRGTCLSKVFFIAFISHDFISLWSIGCQGSVPSQIEMASFFEWASTPTMYVGRTCDFSFIMLSFRMLSRIGVGGCCKVAYKYPGSFAPSRWFPPALKPRIEYGPHGLTHASPRVSPMRTASGYQAPAVPYHTPVVTDFSTPDLILFSGTRNILPTETQRKIFLCASESLCLCVKKLRK